MQNQTTRHEIYRSDELKFIQENYTAQPQKIPYGTDVEGVYFDGYPQIIKEEGSQPFYKVKQEKDIPVKMRDGITLYTDVYRPDVESGQFPALLAFAYWAKDVNEAIDWLADKAQPYFTSPFWDGNMEACDFNYTVPRGFIHVIPDPRGIGNSEGYGTKPWFNQEDVYDMVEWIAAQPWCNGKVGMIGPSAYSIMQIHAGAARPPHLVALRADECGCGTWDYFNGVMDMMAPFGIETGAHANDGAAFTPNYEYTPAAPDMLSHPDIEARLQEALNHPDFKYNTKWYSYLKYPRKFPFFFDWLLEAMHPEPYCKSQAFVNEKDADKIEIPIYLGTPWNQRLYLFKTFDVWDTVSTPEDQKKLILYPPNNCVRPYVEYHDEIVRWHDYWLKNIDTGVMDEPRIKMFVMGINKWRFENEWPLKRTQWTKCYLQAGGKLGFEQPETESVDILDSPAPYLDPTVFCLRYQTEVMVQDMEVTGPVVMNLFASIDIDDTNWFIDLVDKAPDGSSQVLSSGALKAKHRALDPRSTPSHPIHPWADPVPVTPGELTEYNIALMPMAAVIQEGHQLEVIIRNQDDLMGRLAGWGVYHMPFMQTVLHKINIGKSHLLLPIIPKQ